MTKRRQFIKQIATAGALASLPGALYSYNKEGKEKIWASLIHLSFNMWEDWIAPERAFRGYRPTLEFSEAVWRMALKQMVDEGMNMVIIDLGDGIIYDSHPEIAVNNAWTVSKLKLEIMKLRKLGLEPIPKLNFSTTHDTWLGKYSRMVSTKKYYRVCSDLISEVCDIFENPRFFHIGMDEESAHHQRFGRYAVVRQGDLWWDDFYFYVNETEKKNVRAWIWSDYYWNHPEVFLRKMPKSVLQSNWYYGEEFETPSNKKDANCIDTYIKLFDHGYDQVPTASYYNNNDNSIGNTVEYCEKHIDNQNLKGFLQTFWKPTTEEYGEHISKGISLFGKAKSWYYRQA